MQITTPFCGHIAYSHHAATRQVQRSIREILVELLLAFAWPKPAGGGCMKYSFDTETWAEATEVLGSSAAQLERFRHVYLIEDSRGTIRTVAWEH
jgi:hypothetical protein